jgi:hypothetical protein
MFFLQLAISNSQFATFESLLFIIWLLSISTYIFTTMNHSKSTAQDAAASNSNAITAQQRRRLRQQQLLHTQPLPLSPGHYHSPIPIILRRRATQEGPIMNPQELVRLLDQALAISAELVVSEDHRIVDSSTTTTTTKMNSTSNPERDSTE